MLNNNIFVTQPLLPDLRDLELELYDIFGSRIITNHGPKHVKLEQELRDYLKVKNIALYNNATIALMIAFKALDLKGEVIVTPFTFSATIHALQWNNLTPVFCDINEKTMCIDTKKIEALITPRTSAILGVHVYGIPCDVKAIEQIANKHDIKVIYDAAHAFQTEIDGQSIANFGDMSILSFHATKLFNTIEGGAIIFNDVSLKEKLYLLKNFGIKNEEEVLISGINGKLNEVQAAFGLLNLKLVKKEKDKRNLVAHQYRKKLDAIKGIELMELPQNVSNSHQYFPIRITEEFSKNRDEIYQSMKDDNICARKYFYPLCSNYEFYKNLPSAGKLDLPVANTVSNQILCLPYYGNLTNENINRIIGHILD